MRNSFNNDERLRFFLGDIRDINRLRTASRGIDYVVHAAALKQVDTAEYNPYEYVKTNIIGTQNVLEIAIENDIQKVLTLSTDKASSPINLYGATKLAADKLTIAANHYSANSNNIFSVIRYGNVAGSRGSLLPLINKLQKSKDPIPLTHKDMTRFWINFEQAVNFVHECLTDMKGGELFVPKIPSVKISDVFQSLLSNRSYKEIGIRPGEKLHEEMISREDARRTIDVGSKYVVLPTLALWGKELIKGEPVPINFSYNSNTNSHFLKSDEIKTEYEKYLLTVGT